MTWILRDILNAFINTPIGSIIGAFCLMFFDYFISFPIYFYQRFVNGPPQSRPEERLPSGLLIIPTLLRGSEELEAIQATIENLLVNGYPGTMLMVASIDGTSEAPAVYAELTKWIESKQASLPADIELHITGTARRRGKPLAIEHAVQFVKDLVAKGAYAEIPKIYFSTDADADMGPHALEHIARRLCKKNFFTGSPGRAVAGNLYVRGNSFWKGWRHYFTVEGQLSIQVAREYLVTNIARYNRRPFPLSGTTGVLYCIWTDIFLEGPRFMGFMQTLKASDWVKWWFGAAPPKFSESNVKPIPELLAGDTDDTVSAFLAIIARWENGRFTLDAPRTPLHAFYYMLRGFFFDRALRYEPEARVYTSSPSTLKVLWKQRVRWNTARLEVAGRFSQSFKYHWDLGLCAMGVVAMIFKYVFFGLFYYVQVPFAVTSGAWFVRVGEAFLMQFSVYGVWTLCALIMNSELRRNWRLLLAVPAAPLYTLTYSFWTTFTGVINDAFLFGNVTKFAPESTLIKGNSNRVAILARFRRATILAIRAVVYGDVPFGLFWFGWSETPWTPSGYAGWTTNRKPTLHQRLRYGLVKMQDAATLEAMTPLVMPHEIMKARAVAVAPPPVVITEVVAPPVDELAIRRSSKAPPSGSPGRRAA